MVFIKTNGMNSPKKMLGRVRINHPVATLKAHDINSTCFYAHDLWATNKEGSRLPKKQITGPKKSRRFAATFLAKLVI